MSSLILKFTKPLFLNNRSLASNISYTNLVVRNITSNEGENCKRSEPAPKKPNKKVKTPKGKFDDDFDEAPPSYAEKEPLKPHPGGVNPVTGEKGGPKGPEPTRYGDWERKGRVSDF